MYELIIPLQQYTPMVHFEAEHNKNACLRATDVKPRIDKYILKLNNYYTIDKEEEIVIERLKTKVAKNGKSDYQLRIKCTSIKKLIAPEDNDRKLYYGKSKLIAWENISLEITSFDKQLLKLIYLALPVMFAFENFGTRGNKGYGSFGILENTAIQLPEFLKEVTPLKLEDIYKKHLDNNIGTVYTLSAGDLNYHNRLFTSIYYFYNTLKGGVNEDLDKKNPNKYSKSLLFNYLFNNNCPNIWEKRFFKLYITKPGSTKLLNNVYFYRILLGYTTNYLIASTYHTKLKIDIPARMDPDYGDTDLVSFREHSFSIFDSKFDHGNLKKNDSVINRAESPIFFKPVFLNGKFIIYFVLKPELYISEILVNEKFVKIDLREQKFDFGYKTNERFTPIKNNIPTIKNFDLIKFILSAKGLFDNQINDPINIFVKDFRINPL